MTEQSDRISRARILRIAAVLTALSIFLGSSVPPILGKRVLLDSQAQGCLPWPMYWAIPTQRGAAIKPGDLVVFDTPKMLAIDPNNAYGKLKMVGAVAGQSVTVKNDALWIDGQYWGKFWIAPWIASRKIDVSAPWFHDGHPVDGTWVIPPGEVLLLGTEPYSFDGRYWGTFPVSRIGVKAAVL